MSGGGDLAARVGAARDLRDDFERAFRSALKSDIDIDIDWQGWAARLSAVLGTLLALLEGPAPAATVRFPDGSAFIEAKGVQAVLALGSSLLGETVLEKPDVAALLKLARELGGAS